MYPGVRDISGANPDGTLGVESWVHVSLAGVAKLQPKAVSPRLLVLRIDGPKVNVTHVVAHAPVNNAKL